MFGRQKHQRFNARNSINNEERTNHFMKDFENLLNQNIDNQYENSQYGNNQHRGKYNNGYIQQFDDVFDEFDKDMDLRMIQQLTKKQTKAYNNSNKYNRSNQNNNRQEESIEEFTELSEQHETPQIVNIFKKFASTGQMSKTEYNLIKAYAVDNISEIKQFVEKLKSSPGILGQYDVKLASILVNIVNKLQNVKNSNQQQPAKQVVDVDEYLKELKRNNSQNNSQNGVQKQNSQNKKYYADNLL